MSRRLAAIAAAAVLAAGAVGCGADGGGPGAPSAGPDAAALTPEPDRGPALLSGSAERIDGRLERLNAYRGRVVLVVNTASRCGYTGQFEGLQALYAAKRERGLVVLGFPSNDFRQELADDAAVAEFCRAGFGVEFPMFARVGVTGAAAHPLFVRLANRSRAPEWNFHKYLLDRRGRLAAVFAPAVEPSDPAVTAAVERLLAEPAPAAAS